MVFGAWCAPTTAEYSDQREDIRQRCKGLSSSVIAQQHYS